MDEIYALERTIERRIFEHFRIETTVEVSVDYLITYRIFSAEIVFDEPLPKYLVDEINKYVAHLVDRDPSRN